MKKKLLSVLLALTMMLTVLPVSALAAELTEDQKSTLVAQGYSEEEIANAIFISEDTELTEDVEGLIIIVAPVKVTIKGAKLTTGLLIAPGAKGASVVLGESANVNAVIVMDTAEVTVEEKAVAASVTVTAPEAKVAVAGEVKTVTVAAEAEKAAVTVAETAKIDTVEVAAPAAAVEVAGAVASVAVAETAAGASVAVAETATVSALEVAAPDVKADVAGTVESVTVAETATGAELAVAETAAVTEVADSTGALTVSGDGAANVTVTDTTAEPVEPTEPAEEDKKDEEEEPADTTDGSISKPSTPTVVDNHMADPGIKVAPLEDKGDDPKSQLFETYGVSVENADADNEFKVTVKVTGLKTHEGDMEGDTGLIGWVGIAIPLPENSDYVYYMLNVNTNTGRWTTGGTDWSDLAGQHNSRDDGKTYDYVPGTDYNTFYFSKDFSGYSYQIYAVRGSDVSGLTGRPDNAEFVLDLWFDIGVAEQTTPINREYFEEISAE